MIRWPAVSVEPRLGNSMPLKKVPVGMTIHNVEMQPGRGGQICRTAGGSAVLTAREGDWAQVTLPSGETRRMPSSCRATIGSLSNPDHMNISLGKAGRKRWLGRKPHNRGVSMNPVDHPMGAVKAVPPGVEIPVRRQPCWRRVEKRVRSANHRTMRSSDDDVRDRGSRVRDSNKF